MKNDMRFLDMDANLLQLLRVMKKLGLLSRKTYLRIGQDLIVNGKHRKDQWRQQNWKAYLKNED